MRSQNDVRSGSSFISNTVMMTMGFLLGIGTSAITAVGMYIWYYRNNDKNGDQKCTTIQSRGGDMFDESTKRNNSKTDIGSISFLSDMINALWDELNEIAVHKIRTKCEVMFTTLSYPFNNLHFTQISLGHVPFRMDHVHVTDGKQINSMTKQKYVQITLDMMWDGECNIQLQSSIGKFGIRSIKFRGHLLIDCQPIGNTTPSSILPVIQYTFINTPEIHITDFTGLASIADIQSIKTTIQEAIIESIHDMNMVLPKRTVMRITHDTQPSFLDIYQPPIGVLQMTLIKGYGFDKDRNNDNGSDTQPPPSTSKSLFSRDVPDIYVTVSIGNNSNKTLWKSSVIRNSTKPVWKENNINDNTNTVDTLLFHYDQIITFSCYDRNTVADDGILMGSLQKDTLLGVVKVTVAELLFYKVHDLPLQIYRTDGDGNNNTVTNTLATILTGAYLQVQCHLFAFAPYLPINTNKLLQQPTNMDSIHSVVTLLVSQAFNVPESTSYVKITFGNLLSLPLMVPISIDNDKNPIYDSEFHIPITYGMMEQVDYNVEQLPSIQLSLVGGTIPPLNKEKTQYVVDTKTNQESLYGSIDIPLSSTVLMAPDCIYKPGPQLLIDKNNNTNANDTKLEFVVSIQTVAHSTTEQEDQPSVAPISSSPTIAGQSLKVTIVKGWGFTIENRGAFKTNDIPDIYCIVQCGSNPTTFTTSIVKNSTAPIWNESFTFFISLSDSSSLQQQLASTLLRIDVYDSDTGSLDDDDEIGHVNVPIHKVLIAPNHTYDVELLYHGKPTNSYITIQCEKVVTVEK